MAHMLTETYVTRDHDVFGCHVYSRRNLRPQAHSSFTARPPFVKASSGKRIILNYLHHVALWNGTVLETAGSSSRLCHFRWPTFDWVGPLQRWYKCRTGIWKCQIFCRSLFGFFFLAFSNFWFVVLVIRADCSRSEHYRHNAGIVVATAHTRTWPAYKFYSSGANSYYIEHFISILSASARSIPL